MRERCALALALLLAAAPAGAAGSFVCYKSKDLKQPKFVGTTLPLIEDQLGSRSDVAVKKPALLCSPASVEAQAAQVELAKSTLLALKGFSMTRIMLPVGGQVDVYDLHIEAGGDPQDDLLRAAGVAQLAAFINANSAGRAVIVGGDFNLHTDDEPDSSQYQQLIADTGLIDSCEALGCPDQGRIDKILVRSSAQVTLTPTSYSVETADFLDGNGDSLSDHEPVAVGINWTVVP